METFADRLQLVKEEKGLKSTELAEKMGISRQAITNYFREENPSKPKPEHVEKLCNYFGYNYKWLMYGVEPKFSKHEASYINAEKTIDMVEEKDTSPMMSIKNVLETYYKEIEIIKELLNLKQDAYRKVIFPERQ